MFALQASDVGSSPIDSTQKNYSLQFFTSILNRGLTFVVKNDKFFILYFDKTSLVKKFTSFYGNTTRFNFKGIMMDGLVISLKEVRHAFQINYLLL